MTIKPAAAHPPNTEACLSPKAEAALRLAGPVWVFDNWSAYTDGKFWRDHSKLTEALSLELLEHVGRLKELGVQFDYYMMNGFWTEPDSGFRLFRRADWPEGPDRWITRCQEIGVIPGLWFGLSLWGLTEIPDSWKSSLNTGSESPWQFPTLSCADGGFLPDLMDLLRHWYDRGIRFFELDMADFGAATAEAAARYSPEENVERNKAALRTALEQFRAERPDALVVAFNNFGGDIYSTAGPFPFRNPLDLRWAEAIDAFYCGDIRISDTPTTNLWRSIDLYTDHQVRRYEQSGLPLRRIDGLGITLSTTQFGYERGKRAFKGAVLLGLAHGGWKQTIYGDIGLLDTEDARWLARAQDLHRPLLLAGETSTFGGIPGEGAPYGFVSMDADGAIFTVVNPAFESREVHLEPPPSGQGRLIFRDAGFVPELRDASLILGPGQMAVIGFGRFAVGDWDLGQQDDVVIPQSIEPLPLSITATGPNAIAVTLTAPEGQDVWIVLQQRDANGNIARTKEPRTFAEWDMEFGSLMTITARQGGRELPVENELADRFVLFGTSWNLGRIRAADMICAAPLEVSCSSNADFDAHLEARGYAVKP